MSETDYLLPAIKGGISIRERDGKITDVLLLESPPRRPRGSGKLAADIAKYFSGERVNLDDYEVDYSGYTDFQRKVLRATRKIPYGQTKSYAEVAKDAGSPRAARAVGQVMARNRTCIFVPCHRVVASNGIGGWSGSIEWKFDLLELEGSLGKVKGAVRHTRSRAGKNRQ